MYRDSTNPIVHELVSRDWPEHPEPGFVVMDFETTGFDPVVDRVVEVGLVRLAEDGSTVAAWSSLINPGGPVGASHVHGLTEEDLIGAPTFADIADEIFRRIRQQVLVAHNYSFDGQFLAVELGRTGWRLPQPLTSICTLQNARKLIPDLSRYRLGDCVSAIGLSPENGHHALDDALMATHLLRYFIEVEERSSIQRIRQAPRFAYERDWVSVRGEPQQVRGVPRKPGARRFPKSGESDSDLRDLFRSNRISVSEVIGDDAPQVEVDYVELLLDALEDLQITPDEIAGLDSVAHLGGVDAWRVRELRLAIFQIAVEFAWIDGRVSRREKGQIDELALLLDLDLSDSSEVISQVDSKRKRDLGQNSRALPSDWSLGSPLRVGDAVVFTGCEESGRQEMEAKARSAGLRVVGTVSGKTRVLVSDGTMFGSKLAKAEKLGVRVVNPEEFWTLLNFIQPSS